MNNYPAIVGFYDIYEYDKGIPLAFVQMIALSNTQKLQLLTELDKLYADTEQETTEWALEYQVVARMLLHEGWLPFNTRHLNMGESLNQLKFALGVGNYFLLKKATAIPTKRVMEKYLEEQG